MLTRRIPSWTPLIGLMAATLLSVNAMAGDDVEGQPDADQQLLLQQLKLPLPQQPPPRIRTNQPPVATPSANPL